MKNIKKLLLLSLVMFPSIVNSEDITKDTIITNNGNNLSKLVDANYKTYLNVKKDQVINIKNENNLIDGIYIEYELKGYKATLKYDNESMNIGENNFVHEYIKLDKETNSIDITYNENAIISDIYVLSKGELPDYIQNWNKPCSEADLMLFTTHADDEQLFFLGLLPTYVDRGMNVQVVYLADHSDNQKRIHEQLDGLWTVGIRNYPILGVIPDAYSESLEGAINNLKKANLDQEDVIKFQVEMIRRFKPLVIVGHDIKGEYSHGQHILNTDSLIKATLLSNDSNYYSDIKYDLWEAKKVYLHLYGENKIVMDYDTPLKNFNGKTAYEVSKEGYKKHESQQWTWFTKWINGKNNEYTKSTDITKYSPNQFGLYKTTVGEDVNKNDMFENIVLRKDEVKDNPKDKKKNSFKETSTKKDDKFNYLYIAIPIVLLSGIITLLVKRNIRK